MTRVRCATYTRKSSEEGLEQSFNSLDAQREACLSYILRVNAMKGGGPCPRPTTMAAFRVAQWTVRR